MLESVGRRQMKSTREVVGHVVSHHITQPPEYRGGRLGYSGTGQFWIGGYREANGPHFTYEPDTPAKPDTPDEPDAVDLLTII